uniref:Uncharacterized protein n=1 Tax=Arcella intermedia TaxID=1963864 RepID=A0A6B2LWG4_9EUKA
MISLSERLRILRVELQLSDFGIDSTPLHPILLPEILRSVRVELCSRD